MDDRYYLIPSDRADPDYYFRVGAGGVYDRWDRASRTWVHVPDNNARAYLSRAIEGGDAVPASAAAIKRMR